MQQGRKLRATGSCKSEPSTDPHRSASMARRRGAKKTIRFEFRLLPRRIFFLCFLCSEFRQIVRAEFNRLLASNPVIKTAAIELRLAGSPLRNRHPKEPLPEVCNCPIPEVKASFGVREGAE